MERAFAGLARTTYIYGVCTVIWALLAAMLASPPDVRKGHFQGWPEPHIYTVYVRYFGHQAAMLTSPPDVWKGHLQGWPDHIYKRCMYGILDTRQRCLLHHLMYGKGICRVGQNHIYIYLWYFWQGIWQGIWHVTFGRVTVYCLFTTTSEIH